MKTYVIRLNEAQNHRCCYCGHRMEHHVQVRGMTVPPNVPTRDHLEPRIYGGKTHEDNLLIACRQCNNLRGEMDAIAFFNLLQKWFKRDPTLHGRWHSLTPDELRMLKVQCYEVHRALLCGRARKYKEFAFRHFEFTIRLWQHERWQLATRARSA